MNKKGFTLVELIATIALLAIIAIISFVSINAVLEKSKVENCESLVRNITSAAKEYVSDNRYNFTSNGDKSITVNELVTGNYLSEMIVDPFTDDEIDSSKVSVSIKLNDDYSAKEIVVQVNSQEVNCDNKNIFEYARK